MKKRLLMAALAVVCAAGAYAYSTGDYLYTKTGRFKVTGDNMVTNGDFSSATNGWTNATSGAVSADVWSVEPGMGPNGENVLQSLGATAGEALCGIWQLEPGMYVVSYDVKGDAYGIISTSSANNNYADFFINTDGALTKGTLVTGEDRPTEPGTSLAVAADANFDVDWTTVSYSFTIEQGEFLAMNFEKFVTGTMLTNISIHQVTQVYDIRPLQKRIDYVQQLMDNPAFNTEEAQEARANLADYLDYLNMMIESGEIDFEDEATIVDPLNDNLNEFLDVASVNIGTNTYFNYVENLTAFPKYNRGSITNEQQIGGFKFRGDNWLHGDGSEFLNKQIQTSFVNGPGSVALYNTQMPAGKYFISAEMRNAKCDKNYVYSFNIERPVKAFVGTDSVDCGTIVGEDFVRFFYIGELKEGETFEAGFKWFDEENKDGSSFQIKGFEVRAFDKDIEASVQHQAAWNKFIAQWEAAVNARNSVVAMQTDANYPWEKDSLQKALTAWDPYFNAVVEKGWVTAEGTDAGVATTEELDDWALYQGVEMYNEEGALLEYQVVRGYQNAINYVKASNQLIADLQAAIADAKLARDNDKNIEGDKGIIQPVIDDAETLLADILANTTDAKREADEARITAQIADLASALEAFIASGELKPFVDIDFSNKFELATEVDEYEVETQYYYINGDAGRMTFDVNEVQLDNTVNDNYFCLGFNGEKEDVLHVGGGSYGSVALPVALTDDDVLNVTFDLWYGQLGKGYLDIILENAAGEIVAGFSYDCYNNAVGYNDFDDEAHTGMAIAGNVNSAHDKGSGGALDVVADSKRNSFDLVLDFKARTVQGTVNGSKKVVGADVPMKELEDNKVVTFRVGSGANDGTGTYVKANPNAPGRRCWFDNLKMFTYKSTKESGIETVTAAQNAKSGIYSITGQKLNSVPAKGLYIQNGKKYVVK